jgi:superfamily II DNA or RNA helicase
MQPRPYQTSFIEAVERGWPEFKKQLGVAPTGAGKTIIFSWLAKRLFDSTGKRTLILAHREELIDQAIAKLHAATGIIADKEKADFSARLSAPVVVASIQTMIRRLDKWPQDHFGLVVADEAHHVLAKSWRTVLDHFNGDTRTLGVTATPDRGDKKNLGEFFENIAHEIKLLDLIRQGFLCPITIRSIPLKIDLSAVSSIAGDLDAGEIGNVIEPFMSQIASAIKQTVGDRKTLCFLPLISTSKKFVDECRSAGINAEHVDGESDDRAEKLKRFANGDFQLLSNAMLLTEGYDCPDISCIVVLRPTRSRPLYAQMCGRGTRIAEGKDNLLLLDFLWMHERHDLVHPAHLIAPDEETAQEMTDIYQDAEPGGPEDFDLLQLSSDVAAKREEALRNKLAAMSKRKATFISAEEFALRYHQMEIAEFEPVMRWHSEQCTAKQVEWLEKAGVDPESVRGKGQASAILDVFFRERGKEPASDKQRWVMQRAGWRSTDGARGPFEATRNDAREFFAARGTP